MVSSRRSRIVCRKVCCESWVWIIGEYIGEHRLEGNIWRNVGGSIGENMGIVVGGGLQEGLLWVVGLDYRGTLPSPPSSFASLVMMIVEHK